MKTIIPLLALLLLVTPSSPAAQDAPTTVPGATVQQPAAQPGFEAVDAAPLQDAPGSPFQQQGPPRTLRAFWHVFIAYAITIVLLFGYAVSIGMRLAAVERRLTALGAPEGR
jgi:CcmD family protein